MIMNPALASPDYWSQFDQHLDNSGVDATTGGAPPTSGVNGGANLGSLATDPTAPPAPGAAPTAKPGGDPEGFRAAWFASGGKTVDDLKAFVAAHPEFGATITGSKGSKLTFPGGQAFQAVRSAGLGGGIGPAWDDISGGEGGAAGGPGSYGGLVSPMSEFTPPTAEDALNSPGLQFALSEANRMGQNSAAAKGTLLNGRFQQALAGSNIQNALQGYGSVYDRAANTFGINYGVKTGNQDRPFSKYYQLASLGQKSVGES